MNDFAQEASDRRGFVGQRRRRDWRSLKTERENDGRAELQPSRGIRQRPEAARKAGELLLEDEILEEGSLLPDPEANLHKGEVGELVEELRGLPRRGISLPPDAVRRELRDHRGANLILKRRVGDGGPRAMRTPDELRGRPAVRASARRVEHVDSSQSGLADDDIMKALVLTLPDDRDARREGTQALLDLSGRIGVEHVAMRLEAGFVEKALQAIEARSFALQLDAGLDEAPTDGHAEEVADRLDCADAAVVMTELLIDAGLAEWDRQVPG